MDEFVRKYYQNVVIKKNFRNSGKIENPKLSVGGKGCRGSGHKDILFLYLRIEEDIVKDIKYECAYCDPTMYVTAEILCDLVKGLEVDKISSITEENFFNVLGSYSRQASEHWKPTFDLLLKEISNFKKEISLKGVQKNP